MRRHPVLAISLACLLVWTVFVARRIIDRNTGDRDTGGREIVATAGPRSSGGSAQSITVRWPAKGQAAIMVADRLLLGPPGAGEPVPIASVAKVMTAYLVLREHPLDGPGFTVTITEADVAEEHRRAADDESVVPVAAGEVLDESQLLEALLLPSGNNIAELLAQHESGSVAAFVDRMNTTARALAMRDTVYTDPSGLDTGTTSTASDQLLLAGTAMRLNGFARIVAMTRAQLPVAGTVRNTNPLLGSGGFLGVKTGSDDAAGGCLAFASVRTVGGRQVEVIGVVLGQRGSRLIDSAAAAARRMVDGVFAQLGAAGGR